MSRPYRSAALALALLPLLTGQAQAKKFKYEMKAGVSQQFIVPEARFATVVVTGDGEDSEITIDATAVKGRVRIAFDGDLSNSIIKIRLPDAAKPMSVTFGKGCDVTDCVCEISSPVHSVKDQPWIVQSQARDDDQRTGQWWKTIRGGIEAK